VTGRAEGDVLRAWREQKGLTQKDLASKAGIHFSSIGAYERGKRRAGDSELARICAALDVEPFRLCLDLARARADQLEPMVAEVRSKSGQAPLSDGRLAELEWACGIVLHALQEIIIYFVARRR